MALKRFFSVLINFIKKNGVFGILAIATLYIPTWIGFILQSDKIISFGWKWAAIWALPIPPAWLAIALIAGLYRWIYNWIMKRISKNTNIDEENDV